MNSKMLSVLFTSWPAREWGCGRAKTVKGEEQNVQVLLTEKTFWSSRMSEYHASSPMNVMLRITLRPRAHCGTLRDIWWRKGVTMRWSHRALLPSIAHEATLLRLMPLRDDAI
jgi:hypothetical protein